MPFLFEPSRITWSKDQYNNPTAFYKLKIPSVSTILTDMIEDPELEQWKITVGEEAAQKISTAAANRGSALHEFIENFINEYTRTKDVTSALKFTQLETLKKLTEQLIPKNKIDEGRNLFYKFYESSYAKEFSDVIKTELHLYSRTFYFRGKLDVIYNARVFEKVITDFKTSSSEIKKDSIKEKKYKLQLGAYAIAVEDMFSEKGLKINKSTILCVSTKSNFLQSIEIIGDELEKYKEEWKTLVKGWHIKNNQEFLIN